MLPALRFLVASNGKVSRVSSAARSNDRKISRSIHLLCSLALDPETKASAEALGEAPAKPVPISSSTFFSGDQARQRSGLALSVLTLICIIANTSHRQPYRRQIF
jgi:hypothetical protein